MTESSSSERIVGMDKIKRKHVKIAVEDKHIAELERCAYEVTVAKNLISYFVRLCKEQDAGEMLDGYIEAYRADLTKAETHRQMLMNKMVDQYFPDELGWEKQDTQFYFDFDRKEIVFSHAATSETA